MTEYETQKSSHGKVPLSVIQVLVERIQQRHRPAVDDPGCDGPRFAASPDTTGRGAQLQSSLSLSERRGSISTHRATATPPRSKSRHGMRHSSGFRKAEGALHRAGKKVYVIRGLPSKT